ncbi:response regulator [Oscillatoria sp. FACHB-1407]|uniref:sensor histidine kinase n=1 Tax=Oscillatoria sp. FACHB-1407 TaxID=2692847 RepID=UPI0016880A56|nr:response regulator [Oscillatoria sp. FACHB-1407]MBD2461912.1 response regulator [Oscillatoria sp. FACHB-1407]
MDSPSCQTSRSILIADDNPANLQVLSDLLEQSGFKVFVAKNGSSAFEKAILIKPDIILLDIRMPGIDGFKTCERLKNDFRTKEIPIIFLSALDQITDKITAFKVGGADYITKPFQKEEVLARIQHQLSIQLANSEIRTLNSKLQEQLQNQAAYLETIRLALAEKDILLQEVHHRVKNNLQVVSSILKLQAARITDPVALSAFQASQARIDTIAMIHHLLYGTKSFAQVDFKLFLSQLCNALLEVYDKTDSVSVCINADNFFLGIDKAIPCSLIINELLTNALKYAFKDRAQGKIVVSLSKSDTGECRLLIEDDGIGFSEENYNMANPTTLGLKLVKILTRQLQGQLKFEGSPQTRFLITFNAHNDRSSA